TRQEILLRQQTEDAAVGLAQAALGIESAEANLAAASEALLAANQAYDAVQARYAVQAATIVDLIQVESQRLAAAVSVVEQRYQLILSLFAAAYQSGQIDGLLANLGGI